MSNYYNEHDPKAAAWLRELIKAGLIPDGDVDERSITEINANELYPYTQCHFFAGIGGWSLALQLAGVPATTRLWTGSCPCQPFSSAGKGLAQADERHLWPTFFDLIKECRPDTVFGEQVASAIGHGWLDGIQADLESENYACGAAVLGAHSVGAPHIRQRLYWVADSDGKQELSTNPIRFYAESGSSGSHSRVADSEGIRLQEHGECELRGAPWEQSETGELADSELCRRERIKVEQCTGILKTMDGKEEPQFAISPHSASFRRLADSSGKGYAGGEWGRETGEEGTPSGHSSECREHGWLGDSVMSGCETRNSVAIGNESTSKQSENSGFWDQYDIIPCRDGKQRRIECQSRGLADGVPTLMDTLRGAGATEEQIEAAINSFPLVKKQLGRTILLKGYGNAIVPQVASEFIKAFISTLENTPTNE